ncbi:growth-regulating factor 8-like [Olea europaea var. sylvestris]|uniref:growth-regulating factor 8-like n=1 Tax=Olea europaea var. sylvestris TaxID=158386 RepID=UPI000C1D024D|nr:growth-regulating factor 8-like [Olea europaea var. sylvestris]
MGDGNKIGIDSSLECDFGLGLKMQVQPTESSICKRAMVFPHYYQLSSSQNNSFSGVGSGGGVSNIYDSLGGAVFSRSSHYNAPKGGVLISGKALFTDKQWQELERQNMIYKYIMASIPVPPQLLLQLSNAPDSFQSKTSGLDLRFSRGSDPEPWRCRRTDGKKWRCSRDVAPDQKYCERHAHKSKARSRKPVETQSHNSTTTTNNSQQSLLLPPNTPTNQKQMDFTAPYDQTRCTEWLMGGGSSSGTITLPVSTCNRQWHQRMQSSSKLGHFHRDNKNNLSVFQQDFMNSFLDHPKLAYLQGNPDLNTEKTQTTRHFIDEWSTGEKEGNEGSAASLNKKRFSPSSLSLSMSRGIGIGEDNDRNAAMGIGTMNTVKENDGFLNTVSWLSSPPGGPLGEVLGLGNGAGGKGCLDLTSPHGYSNSTTNSSCCSKSSCEDGIGTHSHNFIG